MKTTRPFNRSRVLAFTLLFGALALSCSDDFVYVNSENQNSETYFNTEEDYQNALIGAYDMLQSSYINVMLGEIASANTLAGGESATDVIGIQQIDDMIHTPTNEQLRSIWSWMSRLRALGSARTSLPPGRRMRTASYTAARGSGR